MRGDERHVPAVGSERAALFLEDTDVVGPVNARQVDDSWHGSANSDEQVETALLQLGLAPAVRQRAAPWLRPAA